MFGKGGVRVVGGKVGMDYKGILEIFWGVTVMFIILTGVMVSYTYTYIKLIKLYTLKFCSLLLCQLYFSKDTSQKNSADIGLSFCLLVLELTFYRDVINT